MEMQDYMPLKRGKSLLDYRLPTSQKISEPIDANAISEL
jgi:hypothetical protein